MIKNVSKITLLMTMFLPALVSAQNNKYEIHAKIGVMDAPAKAYLIYIVSASKNKIRIDSTEIKNGTFSFNGTITEPVEASIVINPLGNGLRSVNEKKDFYLEPGMIRLFSPDSLSIARVNAGEQNMGYEKLRALSAGVHQRITEMNHKYALASPEQKKSKEFTAEIMGRLKDLGDERKSIMLQFIKNNPDAPFSLMALKDYVGAVPDYKIAASLFSTLSVRVRSSSWAQVYGKYLDNLKMLTVGSVAPDFTQTDTLGIPVSLHDFKGKYVLIDFWASWCGPCRGENPNVVKAYSEFKNKGLVILGISLDYPGSKDKWLKAIHDDRVTWTQLSDLQGWKNSVAQLYFVKAIPQNFLIDPDGKIVARNLRGEELGKALSALIK